MEENNEKLKEYIKLKEEKIRKVGKDVYKVLCKKVNNLFKSKIASINRMYEDNKSIYERNVNLSKGIRDKMTELEKLVHEHAIGVQNVYDKFTELEKMIIIKQEMKELIESIENRLDEK